MNSLEDTFRRLLAELTPSLTHEDVDQIQDLADSNELGVAFENFCVQLYERGAACSVEQLEKIASIGIAIGVDPSYWVNIETT